MTSDERFMQRCIDLAIQGLGLVAPNPMVGSVVVHENRIIGEGFHQRFGGPHAEVNAIAAVAAEDQTLLANSTLYVNLEPCSHFGKTPPCVDLIISKKIPRVVISNLDPNPLVAGQGIEILEQAGIEVVTNVLNDEGFHFNRRFFTFHHQHRPYIILKWAESSDGFIAPIERKQVWLTSDASRRLVHQWRAEEQAIIIGKNTALIDNPELTVRLTEGKNPIRIVFDKRLQLPRRLKLFANDGQVFVLNEVKDEVSANINFIKLDFAADALKQLMSKLYDLGIQSLIVEGGAETLSSFVEAGLWDEARVFTAQAKLGDGKAAPVLNTSASDEKRIEADVLRSYFRT